MKKKKLNIKKNIFLKKELIRPTKIYVDEIITLNEKKLLKGCANITGGGLKDYIGRIIPKGCCAEIDLSKIKTKPIFKWIKENGVNDIEMYKTFNCGVGFCIIVEMKDLQQVQKHFNKEYEPYIIGKVSKGKSRVVLKNKISWL